MIGSGKGIARTIVVLMIASACHALGAEMSDAEMEALYLERFNALFDRTSRTGLDAYDPLKRVPGAGPWRPLPVRAVEDRQVDDSALRQAAAYAGRNNSSAFIVWVDGAIESQHYSADFQPDSLIVGKSLAKPLGVIAVGRAIEKGFIESLSQPASDFITEWRGTPKADITIEDLLGMQSGLLPQAIARSPDDILNRAYLHPAHDEVIINDYPLVDPPGERYEYSNANSEMVSPIIKRSTGVAYEDWVASEVLVPLGAPGGEIWMNREGGVAHSGCCILLPAEAYLRLAILLLRDGVWDGRRLLPEGYVAAMRRPRSGNVNAGLGLYLGTPYRERRGAMNPETTMGATLHSEPYAASDLFLFDGNSNQVVYIVPSRQTIVLRLGAWPPKEPAWDNAVLPNTILRGLE